MVEKYPKLTQPANRPCINPLTHLKPCLTRFADDDELGRMVEKYQKLIKKYSSSS